MHAMCKINVGLDITGRREDGYHEIRTLMHTLELFDEMRFALSDELTVSCPGIPQEDNIVTSAVRKTFEYAGINGGLRVDIVKHIPSQAGLGGGSTDAACAIRACSMLYSLDLSADEMRDIALGVGADVPFLIEGGSALCEGIGERLTPLKQGPLWPALIVMPLSLRVNTGEAYRWMDGVKDILPQDFSRLIGLLERGEGEVSPKNAFEAYVEKVSPKSLGIRDALSSLGAFACGLSGSGAAFYGLFRDEEALELAAEGMKRYSDTVIRSRLWGSSYRIVNSNN